MLATAQVVGDCQLVSTTALAFGIYSPQGANATTPLDVSPNALTIACTKGVSAQISLNNGNNFAGTRRMVNETSAYLNYQIYTDASRTTIWDTSSTVSYVSSSIIPRPITVYGRVPAGQSVPSSNAYSDTITARVNF